MWKTFPLLLLLAACGSGPPPIPSGVDYAKVDTIREAADDADDICARRGQIPKVTKYIVLDDLTKRFYIKCVPDPNAPGQNI